MNPILVMCMGLGYFFNLYQGVPLVREGGVMIFTHPVTREFHPVHHPSYVDFFEEVLTETTRPGRDRAALRERLRRGRVVPPPVPDVATPTTACTRSTCGTGARTRSQHLGDVIFVGGDPQACRRHGLPPRRHDARRAGDGRAGRRARPVADALPLPAAVLRPGRRREVRRGRPTAREARGRLAARARSARRAAGGRSRVGNDPWGERGVEDQAWLREPRPALLREIAQQALLFPATRFVALPTRDRRRAT